MSKRPGSGSYRLTPLADADLDEIWAYIAEHSGGARADKVEDDLHAAMKTLAAMPGIGHTRHDLADEPLRFWSVHKFLVIYRAEVGPIQVVRVLHSARDVAVILEGAGALERSRATLEERVDDAQAGRVKPADAVLRKLRAKYQRMAERAKPKKSRRPRRRPGS